MATQTTTWQLWKPTINGDQDSWGIYLNFNADKIENALNALTLRIDSNVSTLATLDESIGNINANLTAKANQISELQQYDQDNDSDISEITNRVTTLEYNVTQLTGSVQNISPSNLTTGSVISTYIAAGAVTTAKIADDAITTAKIAASAVDSTEINTSAVLSRHIGEDQILAHHLADDQIKQNHIDDYAVQPEHVNVNYVLVPKPDANADGDKYLYNDDTTGLGWRRSSRVTKVQNYSKLFVDTQSIEPGDLLIIQNGGTAGGSGINDWPTTINNEVTPATLDATSVFLANIEAPSSPSHYTTLYTGQNGVANVITTNNKATFVLEDGTSYDVSFPSFNVNELTAIPSSSITENDYAVVFDRSANAQRKVQLQDIALALGWGATVIGGDGGGTGGSIQNQLGIVLGFEINTLTGELVMTSTGGFTNNTAYIDSNGDFILVG